MKAGVLGQTLLDIIDYSQTVSSLFMHLIKKMNAKLVSLVMLSESVSVKPPLSLS